MKQTNNFPDVTAALAKNRCEAYLLVADSSNADMYFATKFRAGDPFCYIQTRNARDMMLISDMEKGRAQKESRIEEIVPLSFCDYKKRLKETADPGRAYGECIGQLLQKEGVRHVAVPRDFPVYTAQVLKEMGFTVNPIQSPLRKLREGKEKGEVNLIRQVQQANEEAMQAAIEAIRIAEIEDNKLFLEGQPLTASRVRRIIEHCLLDHDCRAHGTIVACGKGAADPHWHGEGQLLASEPIVIDIFPQHKMHHYCGDMTRTVTRGETTEQLQQMYDAVLAAQEKALGMLKPGVAANDVHQAVCDEFEERGYFTDAEKGEGYIHSTGHGVGLEVHEAPSIGLREIPLQPGNIITIEPGLYYPQIGGIRLEDLVLITEHGYENLNTFEKEFVV